MGRRGITGKYVPRRGVGVKYRYRTYTSRMPRVPVNAGLRSPKHKRTDVPDSDYDEYFNSFGSDEIDVTDSNEPDDEY